AAGRAGHVRATSGDDRDTDLGRRLLQQPLAAARSRRRLVELAPGQGLAVVVPAAHADELVHLVVVGSDVLVRDRPGDLPAVLLRALEVEVGVAEAHAAPHVRLAAVSPDADELEVASVRREVRLLIRVEEERWRLLAAGLTLAGLPGGHVRPVLRAVELLAGVEQEDVEALAGEVPGGHAPGRAAADDDDGMDLRGLEDLHARSRRERRPDASGACPVRQRGVIL